jgi:hypothetical protein
VVGKTCRDRKNMSTMRLFIRIVYISEKGLLCVL